NAANDILEERHERQEDLVPSRIRGRLSQCVVRLPAAVPTISRRRIQKTRGYTRLGGEDRGGLRQVDVSIGRQRRLLPAIPGRLEAGIIPLDAGLPEGRSTLLPGAAALDARARSLRRATSEPG